ncbi:MAG: dTDP-4-dehydrorhamnose 3,5-epimerase [bacterium]
MGIFKFSQAPNIPDILIVESKAFADERGFFMESYNKGNFDKEGFPEPFIQDNLSKSAKGVVRGLHYQKKPNPMGKLVSCIQGKIFDVGVDVRKGSKTFGQWFGLELSEENKKMLYLPPGFAHGFLSLEDNTFVAYKCTGLYSPHDERAVLWNDPDIEIDWPLDAVGGQVNVSDKDKIAPQLKNADLF